MIHKYKCAYCGKVATWKDETSPIRYVCPQCAKKYKYKLTPSTEFSDVGFNKKDNEKKFVLKQDDINNAFVNCCGVLSTYQQKIYEEAICEIFLLSNEGAYIDYNKFMSHVGFILNNDKHIKGSLANYFYVLFKNELREKKIKI